MIHHHLRKKEMGDIGGGGGKGKGKGRGCSNSAHPDRPD
jgi:hypothetical protein